MIVIHRNGHELEGAHERWKTERSGWHYDSSVEVSGGSEECECEIDCCCDECRRCENSGENIDYCQAETCMRCDQCDYDIDDCECFTSSAFDKECDECLERSFNSEEAIACIYAYSVRNLKRTATLHVRTHIHHVVANVAVNVTVTVVTW